MVVFIIGVLVALVAIPTWVIIGKYNSTYEDDKKSYAFGFVPIALGLVLIGTQCFYAQDIGEAAILKNFGGSIAGTTTEAGLHLKAPWQDVTNWDIRNRLINFYKTSEYSYSEGSYNGACVTVNDSSGTSSDIDIQAIYSIDPSAVVDLYADYGSQEAFVSNYVAQQVRLASRDVAGEYSTLDLLTNKEEYASSVYESLTRLCDGSGVVIESVTCQDVVPPENIKTAYADAQQAEIQRQKAENEKAVAEVEAETKVIEAQGTADSNKILTESLSDELLMQKYIEAIGKSDTVYLLPNDSMPILNMKNVSATAE